MSKLLYSGFYRLRKNKALAICLAVSILYTLVVYITQYQNMIQEGTDYPLEPLFFNFLSLTGILVSVFASLFVGTEYSDGTIRNKLISGLPRREIYLSNFVLCTLAATVIVLASYAIGCAVGIPLFGTFEMPLPALLIRCLIGLLSTLAYISVFNMIAMLSSSKTASAVLCILLSFGILFIAAQFFNSLSQPEYIQQLAVGSNAGYVNTEEAVLETVRNPHYLTGTIREVYQNFLDFLPAGQMMQLINQNSLHTVRLILYSLAIICGTNLAGVYFFCRKDIK